MTTFILYLKTCSTNQYSPRKGFKRENKMTASQQAKAAGLKNLAEVAKLTKQSPQTLNNWHKHKPELFAIVLSGCTLDQPVK